MNLTVNLEPVYGIVLAWFIFDEGEQDVGRVLLWGSRYFAERIYLSCTGCVLPSAAKN